MAAGDPRQVRAALRAMEAQLQGLVEPAQQQLHDAEHMIRQAAVALNETMSGLNRALDQAEDDLDYCRSQVDDEGRRPNCSQYYRRVQNIKDAISQLAALSQRYERSVGNYQTAAAGLREVIGKDIPTAAHWLRDREKALEKFEGGAVGIKSRAPAKTSGSKSGSAPGIDTLNAFGAAAIASGSPALLSAFNSYFAGMGGHGYKYQKARQAYLRSLVNDPNQPRHVRGWIKQELNRIEAAKRAKAAGLQPPGRASGNIRGIPGLDVGHRYPGLDLPENFRLEDVWVNRHRPIIAKRLGIFHLFR
jgi:tetratricopeptide (TPR) repeat protein